MGKRITIDIYLQQTCNDVLTECNLISKNLGEDFSIQLKSDIASPDDGETRGIIMRGHTEALGNVKRAARKYLLSGRTEDDNKLERLATATYSQAKDQHGHDLYDCTVNGEPVVVWKDGNEYKKSSDNTPVTPDATPTVKYSDTPTSVDYDTVTLEMDIPGWDTAVTDALKNHIHKYIVDYVMWRFLQNQHDPKCAEYKKLADEEDMPLIEEDLTMRDRLTNRKPHWWD